MKTFCKIISCIFALLLITGCSTKSNNKKSITVSLPPQAFIAKQIAGDKMEVNTFLSQGANPESYEPSMAQLLALNNSNAYLILGNIGFEEEVVKRIKDAVPDLKVINVSDGIDLLHGTHGHECDGHSHSHADSDVDPHVWSSVANARVIAANTCKALCEIDPENTDYYKSNLKGFETKLNSLDNQIKSILKDGNSKRILVWHPSLSYFARDYGLEQIALGHENKELSASSLKNKIDEAAHGEKVTLLLQKDYDSRVVDVVNKEINAKVDYINPLNSEWADEMLHTARAIAGKN